MTDLKALTREELLAVRDDRSAIADEVFRIIDQRTNVFESLTAILTYVTTLTLEATDENLNRLIAAISDKESTP